MGQEVYRSRKERGSLTDATCNILFGKDEEEETPDAFFLSSLISCPEKTPILVVVVVVLTTKTSSILRENKILADSSTSFFLLSSPGTSFNNALILFSLICYLVSSLLHAISFTLVSFLFV